MKDNNDNLHRVIDYNGKKVTVCNNHCCYRHGELAE